MGKIKLSAAELGPVLHNWVCDGEIKIHLYRYACPLNWEQFEGRTQSQWMILSLGPNKIAWNRVKIEEADIVLN